MKNRSLPVASPDPDIPTMTSRMIRIRSNSSFLVKKHVIYLIYIYMSVPEQQTQMTNSKFAKIGENGIITKSYMNLLEPRAQLN